MVRNVVWPIKKIDAKEASFEVSAALFEELGERLVSKPEIALAELVKNAYDADANVCTLTLSRTEIIVEDNGHGMTETEFLKNWMVISTQSKGLERFSRLYHRNMAGSKGVGRFSARYLGNTVTLTTVAASPKSGKKTKLVATFNWPEITKVKSISFVKIPYTVTAVADTEPSGTILHIEKLRKESTQISASTVKTDILRLTDPASGLEKPPFDWKRTRTKKPGEKGTEKQPVDIGFSVKFIGDEKLNEDDISPSLQQEILDAYVGRVRLHLFEDGKLNYKVFWKDHPDPVEDKTIQISEFVEPFLAENLAPEDDAPLDPRGLVKAVENIQHLPVSESLHSPIFIDLRFFPKRKGTFSDVGVNGTTAHSWIRDKSSLALVDNNFAMASYVAEDSDWLAIDASKALNERSWQSIFTPALYPMGAIEKADTKRNPMLALPRGTQLIGRVHIATRKRPPESEDDSDDWLQPNMDRESLRSNGASRLLWHVARFAAELLAHFDRKMRLQAEEAAYRRDAKETRTALSAAIKEIKSSVEIQPEYRERVVQQLKDIEARIDESQKYERDARLSLELLSMMGVMAGFMTHEFEKAMDLLNSAASGLKQMAILDPKLRKVAETILEQEQALANYLDYMRVFIERARDPLPQSFKAHAQVTLASKTLSPITNSHNIDTEIAIDAKLLGPLMPIAAYNGIVINLISNAMKALVPKISSEQRKIRLYATNDSVNHVLVCADNGIGIPEYLKKRIWDPLFSTTKINNSEDNNPMSSGLGLGLSVVQQVVEKMRGKIELMDIPPPGYVTAFKVTLPLLKQ